MRPILRRSVCTLLLLGSFAGLHANAAAPVAPLRVAIGNPTAALSGPWRCGPTMEQY